MEKNNKNNNSSNSFVFGWKPQTKNQQCWLFFSAAETDTNKTLRSHHYRVTAGLSIDQSSQLVIGKKIIERERKKNFVRLDEKIIFFSHRSKRWNSRSWRLEMSPIRKQLIGGARALSRNRDCQIATRNFCPKNVSGKWFNCIFIKPSSTDVSSTLSAW